LIFAGLRDSWFEKRAMNVSDLFWLTDAQMARLEPFFPKSHGKPRVDDRRVLSGIQPRTFNLKHIPQVRTLHDSDFEVPWNDDFWIKDGFVQARSQSATKFVEPCSEPRSLAVAMFLPGGVFLAKMFCGSTTRPSSTVKPGIFEFSARGLQ